MGKGGVVENKDIGEGRADEVDYEAEKPEELLVRVWKLHDSGKTDHVMRYSVRVCLHTLSLGQALM